MKKPGRLLIIPIMEDIFEKVGVCSGRDRKKKASWHKRATLANFQMAKPSLGLSDDRCVIEKDTAQFGLRLQDSEQESSSAPSEIGNELCLREIISGNNALCLRLRHGPHVGIENRGRYIVL